MYSGLLGTFACTASTQPAVAARNLLSCTDVELETFLLAASLVPAVYLLVQMERGRSSDPAHVRRFGASIGREVLDAAGAREVIGTFDGGPIYAAFDYLGMRYRFDRVVPPSYRFSIGPCELYVEPGLLYVTAD